MDALWWLCIGAAFAVFGGLYAFQELTAPRPRVAATPRGVPSPDQKTAPAPTPPPPPTPLAMPSTVAVRESITALSPRQRHHTLIAGSTGDGKSTTLYTLLVNDIAHGAHCVVCSTHFTPFHHEDQQIDLRPLEAHFEAYWEHSTIAAALRRAATIIDERMHRYRANQDVGHDIALYIGEWGNIERVLGKKEASDLLVKIIDEGRKTRVWIGAIELHSLLVSRFGSDSAFREAFNTRLAGNVDDVTWKTVVGRDVPKQRVAVGTWMTDSGLTTVERPSYRTILDLAATPPHSYARLVPPSDSFDLLHQLFDDEASAVNGFANSIELVSDTGINAKLASSPSATADTTPDTRRNTTLDITANNEILRAAMWKWLTVDELTGNEIFRKTGGNRNDILALVRTIRAEIAAHAPPECVE